MNPKFLEMARTILDDYTWAFDDEESYEAIKKIIAQALESIDKEAYERGMEERMGLINALFDRMRIIAKEPERYHQTPDEDMCEDCILETQMSPIRQNREGKK